MKWTVLLSCVLLVACKTMTAPVENGPTSIQARTETAPVDIAGDAADDPAIWLHPEDPAASLIIGTQKHGALFVFDLGGRARQVLHDGALNNVDLRYGMVLEDGRSIDLVAASNRDTNGVNLYRIDPDEQELVAISDGALETDLPMVYGLCMGRRPATGSIYVYVNSPDGSVAQYRAVTRANGRIGLDKVRMLRLDSQVEGCVVDDRNGWLFIAEEDIGIWRLPAWPEGNEDPVQVAAVGRNGLAADIEGLAILHLAGGGYLLVSSQGNDSFAVFDLAPPHRWLGGFQVNDGPNVDRVEETDGLAALATALPGFPRGLVVVQDGDNRRPEQNQNFKLLDWGEIADALDLFTHPEWSPREAQ